MVSCVAGKNSRAGRGLVIDRLYWAFAHLGLMTASAAFIAGFGHDSGAPLGNLVFDVALYVVFIAVHIVMTMPAFKRAFSVDPKARPSSDASTSSSRS